MNDLERKAEKLAAKADAVATELIELGEQLAEVNRARRGPKAPDPRQVVMWIEDLEEIRGKLRRGPLGSHIDHENRLLSLDQVISCLQQWRDLQGGYTD